MEALYRVSSSPGPRAWDKGFPAPDTTTQAMQIQRGEGKVVGKGQLRGETGSAVSDVVIEGEMLLRIETEWNGFCAWSGLHLPSYTPSHDLQDKAMVVYLTFSPQRNLHAFFFLLQFVPDLSPS
jgi:hypothetical protein